MLFIGAYAASAETPSSVIEQQHQGSVDSAVGADYEANAVKAFWGDADFMMTCVPPNTEAPDPLTIYFEVTTQGTLGELFITPNNKTAACIRNSVAQRAFPKPPGRWVGKIDLRFSP